MYSHQVELKKREPERALDMKWEVFRDRLRPGQEEEWKLVIKTPQGMPAAAEMLATMYDASLDKIYKSNQILRVFYPDNLYGAFRGASRYNSNYFSVYFPLKAWKVPVWSFDYFCSPYMDGRMRIVMVEDNALLEEVSVVGYGTTRNSSLTGNLRIRGANQPMLASKAESGNAVEVKYVPAQVAEDAVEDVVLNRKRYRLARPCNLLRGFAPTLPKQPFLSSTSYKRTRGACVFFYDAAELDSLEFPWLLTY